MIKLRRRWQAGLLRLALALMTGYGLLALGVMLFQRRLIYFPTRLNPRLAESLAAREGFRPWRNPAGELMGWVLPAREGTAGSALLFHGNAGCAIDRTYLALPLHEAGSLDIYILEYPGYGARPGSPSQNTILAAADEAFGLLPKQMPIYLVAESLGTGPAAHLAQANPTMVRGLMLFVPYDTLASVAQRQMPVLPVAWLLWDRFNPREWLRDYRGPIGFVLAGADEVIPTDLGLRLADGYGGPKRVQLVPGARHNDVATQTPAWWRDVLAFWGTNSSPASP